MKKLGVPGFDPIFRGIFKQHFMELKEQDKPLFETVHIAKDGRWVPKEVKSV